MFAWSHLDFAAIPVSISAVSLTIRQTWQNLSSKRRLHRIQIVQKRKRHQKTETSCCFCLCSFCFWGEVSNSWILNDIGSNFMLGNRKKIAKCLMRTFTCHSSPFIYARGLCTPRRCSSANSRLASTWTLGTQYTRPLDLQTSGIKIWGEPCRGHIALSPNSGIRTHHMSLSHVLTHVR